MNYTEALGWFHSLLRFGIKPGLERITALCAALGNPQNDMKFVHIAGTNGKGSTAAMTDAILRAAGYRTGLFTSPYVFNFRERIKIDGVMIAEEDLAMCAAEVRAAVEQLPESLAPTEFEAITAAAFLCFSREKCDVAVLETGLGGRLDSTNVISSPEVCALTSISLDHTDILGDTVALIAAEKCGIFKSGADVVVYPVQDESAWQVIDGSCAKLGIKRTEAPNYIINAPLEETALSTRNAPGTHARIGGIDIFVPFIGEHMVRNACVAVGIAKCLARRGTDITECNISDGIASARMPARMQIISDAPLIMLDGGHNEGCALALREVLERYMHGKKIYAVCAMMADKAYTGYLRILAPLFTRIFTASPDNPRALPAEALAAAASEFTAVEARGSPSEALEAAKKSAKRGDAVVVCGSFYLMSELGIEA